jgi:hypothetical protein
VAVPLELPSVRRLDGFEVAFQINFDQPRVLHLRAPTPALVSVEAPGSERWAQRDADALSVDVFLPAGRSLVVLRALAGRPLGGDLEAGSSEVVPLSEGLGPEILLGPGEQRFAAFTVERAGPVGVAVRADAEVVNLRLLDARGRPLPGSRDGVLHMTDLTPGRYLMALSLPADHRPVRVRPVVVGLEPPSGPPDEVVQRHLTLAAPEDGQ